MAALSAFGIWCTGVWSWAVFSGNWSRDTGVYLFFGPLVMAAVVVFSLRPTDLLPRIRPCIDRAPYAASIVLGAVATFDVLRTPDGDPPFVLSHERLFAVVIVFSLPKRPLWSLAARAAVGFAFLLGLVHYPTASAVVAFGSVVLMLVIGHLRVSSGVKACLVVAGLSIVTFLVDSAEIRRWFYSLVGRTDNTVTRQFLWSQATQELVDSPISGGGGSAPITALGYIRGEYQSVPLHNSLLSMALVVGLVGTSLFVLLVLLALRNEFKFEREGQFELTCAPALVAAASTLWVNPTLDSLASASVFYMVLLLGVCRPLNSSVAGWRGYEPGRSAPSGADVK